MSAEDIGAPVPQDPCCEETRAGNLARLYNFLDGELEADDVVAIRAHLDHCRNCEREYAIETMLKELVRRSCHDEAPAGLTDRIRARIVLEATSGAASTTTVHLHAEIKRDGGDTT